MNYLFTYNEYVAGGIYIGCETFEEGPYADISIWIEISPRLKESNHIVIPAYKLDKEFLKEVESYGFVEIDYNNIVPIGRGTGYIGKLEPDYKARIDDINKKAYEKYEQFKAKLNELASTFDLTESRKQMVELLKDSESSYWGMNANEEDIEIHVNESEIILKTYQENGAVRVDCYDHNGLQAGTTFEGRWK